jgi:Flp pilus assembly CpaF family ATPase
LNKARKLQQVRQNTVNITTESESKDEIIIETEEDNNPDIFSQAVNSSISGEFISPHAYRQDSSSKYNELALLSKRKARELLRVGNETLSRLINESNIKTILINGKEKIPYVSLQEFIYNMHSKNELEAEEYNFIGEEEANTIATKILKEINKGEK